ncbi:MAG: hypothetical protein J0J10_00985 [Bosea sp.]|uniref:hypothetical protein n=1 Tax=Bosea sp. (in: a-proteobacteria) TaxID=1871050 RepID=UPI001AD045AD|nr:hypothetical protein [Bosea sp. (in: a-proteobacteria)]MBN9467321.1 hypothetical protein [Bosea sp. (in: a-proteobacteria)]
MGKKGGNNEAAQARADEQERQNRIRQGTSKINEIFSGRTIGDGQLGADAVYDPTKTYYLSDGSTWSPKPTSASTGSATTLTGMFGSGGAAQGGAQAGNPAHSSGALDRPEESTLSAADQFRQSLGGGLYSGVKQTSGFNDDYFDKQKQSFLDYATPQLEDQYGDAQKQLTFSLARSGLLDSSVRAEKSAELQKKYDLNKQQIADQALSYSTDARNNVEKARSDLITMLNATGDAEGAANSAMARSQALSQPQAFSPLTQLFADFTSGLGQQAAFERANSMSQQYNPGGPQIGRYNTGLFGNTKSVVVGK